MKKLLTVLLLSATSLFSDIGSVDSMKALHHNNPNNNYYAIEITGKFANNQIFELYINADGDKNTGYTNGIGAEYLITSDWSIFKYIGSDGGSWDDGSNWDDYWEWKGILNNHYISNTEINIDLGIWEIDTLNDNTLFYIDTYSTNWNWQGHGECDVQNLNINQPTISINNDSVSPQENIQVSLTNLSGGNQDWVGIYPKNTSNEWNNVIKWKWAESTEITLDGIPAGEYDARLFFNNSFDVEASVSFNVEEDIEHLFQNLNITQNNNNVIVNNGNDNLMYASKDNFVRTNLDVENSSFTETIGGFDVEFDIKNNKNEAMPLTFTIEIPGINFEDKDTLNILNTLTYMVPVERKVYRSIDDNGQYLSKKVKINLRDADSATSYPDGYSPVIVAHDGKLAVGASMHTTYKSDELALKQFVEHYNNGSWSFIFNNASSINGNDGAGVKQFGAKFLKSDASQHFKISIRFADVSDNKSNNWIYTLAPYKKFFRQTFPIKERDIVERDTRPIIGMTFAYEGLLQGGDKGYLDHPDYNDNEYKKRAYADTFAVSEKEYLADTYVDRLKTKMIDNNYKRVMFWSVSGMYYGDKYDKPEDFNLPSQFLGNLQPKIQNVLNNIKSKLTNNGIDYGFWWGRAGQVPVKDGHIIGNHEWNPDEIFSSNINSKNYGSFHLTFAKNQLQKAIDYGASEVGLDAFINMKNSAQFDWIKEIKNYAHNQGSDITFMQEGKMCDYLHTQFSMYLQPHNSWFNSNNDLRFSSEPVLANYLNPNAEIIAWIEKKEQQNEEYINDLREFGFTPLLNIHDGRVDNIPYYNDQ